MMGLLGTVPLAAHQIALSCAGSTFAVPMGLSLAVGMRVSQAIGAGRRDTVRGIDRMERELEAALGSLLGIAAKVKLLEPNTIERSIGKAVRVVDKRKLLD